MSCQHREDVCQHCLEKVQTTTEDSPPPRVSPPCSPPKKSLTTEEEDFLVQIMTEDSSPPLVAPPKKTMTFNEKALFILMDSSLMFAAISLFYWTLDKLSDRIIVTVEAPTKRQKKTD